MNGMEDYLKQEVRNGFTVSEVMKRSWAADLEIVEDIKGICDKHSLNMFACYGTLLGAVREHGFIAWDDDTDIGLVGMDYVRFLDILSKEYGDKYIILNPYTKSWHNMNFTHITNTLSVSFEREHLKKWHGCPFMTGLDVYPYYYIPRNPDDERFILELLKKIDSVIGMNRQLLKKTANDGIPNYSGLLGQAVAIKLVELQRETGYEFNSERPIANQLEILYDQVCRLTPAEDADYVARYDEYARDRLKKFPKDYFETTVPMPFEYTSMPVPIGYNAILNARFGNDYIVPRNEAGAHDYPYYAKQISDRDYYEKEITETNRVRYDTDLAVIENEMTGTGKKRVLYHTSVREMLIHSDRAASKVTDVLSCFFDLRDILELLWMPDVFLKTDDMALDEVAPELIDQYEKLISEYISNGGHICDIGTEIDKLTAICDEYYGDDGVIADRFRKAGKKTIIQDYSSYEIEYYRKYPKASEDIETIEETGKTEGITEKERTKGEPEIPDEWRRIVCRSDGSRKKIVLYLTSVSVMYQYKDAMLDKLHSVMEIFGKNAEEIAVLWRSPISDDIQRVLGNPFINKLNSMVDEYRRKQVCILIDGEADVDIAVRLADAVYGDADEVMARCLKRGIPVMIQNPEMM